MAMNDEFLPGLPVDLIRSAYADAPGHEVDRFRSPESSAALAANTFGLFLADRAKDLPRLPTDDGWGWPAVSVCLEGNVRFPWSGGRHPWLDVLVGTSTHLIGIESKRYEPFRAKSKKGKTLSEAYCRPCWGDAMSGYARVRDGVRDGAPKWLHLDAEQLFKHAFGLRTAVHDEKSKYFNKKPILFYIYAEPDTWPDAPLRSIDKSKIQRHRGEVAEFAKTVAQDEVAFHSCTYRELINAWGANPNEAIRNHARAITSFLGTISK
jgi:hypothetical protein